MMISTEAIGDIGDDIDPNNTDPIVINQDSTMKCSPIGFNMISINCIHAMITRTVLKRTRDMRPTGLVDEYTRITPKKIHMRAALKAIVLQPEQTLLIRIIPDIFPMMPVMLVSMAKRPKARVRFFNRSACRQIT